MKIMNQWFKRKRFQLMAVLTTFTFIYLPKIVYADARSEAQTKLKNDFSGALNGFTNVFQYLSYGTAVLAVIVSGVGALLIHDETNIKNMKKICTWIMVIAVIIGMASTLVTIATNKTK